MTKRPPDEHHPHTDWPIRQTEKKICKRIPHLRDHIADLYMYVHGQKDHPTNTTERPVGKYKTTKQQLQTPGIQRDPQRRHHSAFLILAKFSSSLMRKCRRRCTRGHHRFFSRQPTRRFFVLFQPSASPCSMHTARRPARPLHDLFPATMAHFLVRAKKKKLSPLRTA